MIFNNRAEKMIRQQIEELTIDRIAPKKNDIENSIKWMYWSGTFTKRKQLKMLELLENKYTRVLEEFYRKQDEIAEQNYQRLLRSVDMSQPKFNE